MQRTGRSFSESQVSELGFAFNKGGKSSLTAFLIVFLGDK